MRITTEVPQLSEPRLSGNRIIMVQMVRGSAHSLGESDPEWIFCKGVFWEKGWDINISPHGYWVYIRRDVVGFVPLVLS